MLRNFNHLSRALTRFYCAASNRTNIVSLQLLLAHFLSNLREDDDNVNIPSFQINVLKEQVPKLNVDEVSSALDQLPQLANFNSSLWQKTFEFLINQQNFPHESCLRIVTSYPQIFTTSFDTTFKQLEAWRACQFGERRLQDLIIKHPGLIQHGNERYLTLRMAFLQGYVQTPKNVWRIMMSSPEVALQSEQTLEAKFKYLMEHMRIEIPDIVDSDVFLHDLHHIKMRHVFMERLGMFKTRSTKKDSVNEKNPNPKLNRIVDTSDKRFATKICFVSLEEYEVFQELLKREWERQDVNDEDDNYDELQAEQGIDVL